LRNRDFRRLWLSNGLWWHGLWMEQIVLGWLALELTNSPWKVAMVGFCRAVPLLLGVFTSPIADRFRRRDLLVVLQVIMTIGIAVLLLLVWFGWLRYWHIAGVSLINGTVWTLDWSTRRALFPDLVGRDRIVDAMLLENITLGLAWFLGPLAGGVLMAWVGNAGALMLIVAIGCGSLVMLLGLKTDSRAPSSSIGLTDAVLRLQDGLRYVRRKPRIRGVLLITVLINAWVFPVQTLLPVFARDILGRGPLGLGVLAGFFGLGSLIGLNIVRWGRRRYGHPLIFVAGSMLCCVAIFFFSLSGVFALSLVLMLVAGIGQAGFSTMQSGIILSESNDEMRGRALAALVLAIGGWPLGCLQCSGMVVTFGAPITVAAMAVTAVIGMSVVVILLPGFVRPAPAD